jgi:molybdopterin-guanine dinucleotide biosynthesis protein A
MQQKVSGILLAGGKSQRMKTNKALLKFKGKELIQYPLAILNQLCNEIVISSNSGNLNTTEYTIVPDEFEGIGPISGIYSCLKKISNQQAIVITCDNPFLNVGLFSFLLEKHKNAAATVPRTFDGNIEPLCAIYSRDVLQTIEESIKAGDYKMHNLVNKLNVSFVDITNDLPFYNLNMFANINTMSDYNRYDDGLR